VRTPAAAVAAVAVTLASVAVAASGWSVVGQHPRYRAAGQFAQLQDGTILLAGGHATNPSTHDYESDHAALFNPEDGSSTELPRMRSPRLDGTATTLADGRVLLVGGKDDWLATEGQASAELFDPGTKTWVSASPLHTGRYRHSATLLEDGRVLIVGGFTRGNDVADTAELFNPVSATFQPVKLRRPRNFHSATRLADGRVLIAGGNLFGVGANTDPEIFDPATDSCSSAAPLPEKRWDHHASLLPDGRVLVTGGSGYINSTTTSTIYDPKKDRWTEHAEMPETRANGSAVALTDGRVLVFGGDDGVSMPANHLLTTWLYEPGRDRWTAGPELPERRVWDVAFPQEDGSLLVVGPFANVLRLE